MLPYFRRYYWCRYCYFQEDFAVAVSVVGTVVGVVRGTAAAGVVAPWTVVVFEVAVVTAAIVVTVGIDVIVVELVVVEKLVEVPTAD